MTHLNVALVMERIEPWRGGAETSTMLFARHLAERRCRVTILTSSDAQSMPGLEVVPIRVTRSLRPLRTLQFSRRAAGYVRGRHFDVVHAITPCLAADVYQPRGGTIPETLQRNLALRPAAASRGFKGLTQKLNLKYRTMARLERRLLQRRPTPWVIAISDYVARQLRRHYDFPPEAIRLIFNGVDPDHSSLAERVEHRQNIRRQLGLRPDDLMALCVAHNFKLKGVPRLIEALAHLDRHPRGTSEKKPRHGLYAVIVGRDDLTPHTRLAEQLGIAGRVIFAGPTQRIAAFFHAADFLVHPTYYDPCSRVVLEGMAAGLPAITTRYNGASEKIVHGESGYVIEDPADVAGLAAAMEGLCDPVRRGQMAARALAAVSDLTMARHADQVMALYDELLRGRAARPGLRVQGGDLE